jgi:hypothetical protein
MDRRCSQQYSRVERSAQEQRSPSLPRKSKDTVAVLGIDIGKNVFHLIGLDKRGAIVPRQTQAPGSAHDVALQQLRLSAQ